MVMDSDYRIVGANQAYRREFGNHAPLIGRKCYEVSHHFSVPCDQAGESCPLKTSLSSGQPQRVLHLHHTPRGEEHVDVETTPIRNAEQQVVYFVETMRVVRQASSRPAAQGLVGRSPAFQKLLERIVRVGPAESPVLLLGETGTGKELLARAVHEASPRKENPFVVVDCAGLTETLFESELFGYERGAFTGANHRKQGLVEAASGGTLFLDEIGELPLSLQVKLLRLLETGTYRRVGGLEQLPADFRLVCATHRNLAKMVRDERFRRDLYYRINTFPIHTPALHERGEDIPLLAASLLERVDRRPNRQFSAAALRWLQRRQYPGNIRELRNLIERTTVLVDSDIISEQDLQEAQDPDDLFLESLPTDSANPDNMRFSSALIPLDTLEQHYLRWAQQQEPEIARLALALGVSERTLYRKIQGLRLPAPQIQP
jgi:transcriptional regulator with PAS, ATPase and Fis domain